MSAAFSFSPLAPVYTLAGDESYHRDAFLAQLRAAVPEATREFGWMEQDLADDPLEAVLDGARSPSLMAPLQVYVLRNAGELFARGGGGGEDTKEGTAAGPVGKKRHGNFPANLQAFAAAAGPPSAVLVFLADHIHIPAQRARISLEDKSRLQRIETTLGAAGPVITCAQATEAEAAVVAQQTATALGVGLYPALARRLAELCDANLALMQREIEKLALYTGSGPIGEDAVAALVGGAASSSAYEIAQQIVRGERAAALASLEQWWRDEGATGAIGLVFQLSRIFSMALLVREERVRDRNGLYRALPEGLRPPGFAADTILAIAQRMSEAALRASLPRLHRSDVTLRSSPPSLFGEMQSLVLALGGAGEN
ncbi:MAG: DNA polymerase III subunit delta [Terriglobales bacterium]